MAFISWTENLSMEIEEIDKQHKGLVNTLSELFEAMHQGKGKDSLAVILQNLAEYTKEHFATEEKYFNAYNYPEAQQHIEEHRKFIEEVAHFNEQFEQGKLFLSIHILEFLKNWLNKHILGTDKKYVSFFKEKGL